jgi:putative hydrolase of the HAD superfamily
VIRAVTFDMTGTLAVPHPGVGAVYAEIARRHGLDAEAGALDAAFPAAFTAAVAAWPRPFGADDADALRFWGRVIAGTFGHELPWELVCDCFDAFAEAGRWRVLPGVRETLAAVRARGLPVAVVSNFDCRLPGLLAGLGLGPFACVVTSAEVGRAKPDPAPMMAACARMGVAAAEVVHVGDGAREDGGMCAACGARFVVVASGAGMEVGAVMAAVDQGGAR